MKSVSENINKLKVNNYHKTVKMKTPLTNAKSLGVFGMWVDMVVVVGDGVGAGAWSRNVHPLSMLLTQTAASYMALSFPVLSYPILNPS